MKETFAQRLSIALKYRGMKQTDLANRSGIYRGTINNYVSGKYEAKQINLMKIAKVLNVSETWLMGYDVPMEENNKNSSFINYVNEDKIELIGKINNKINSLDIERIVLIEEMINNLDSMNIEQIESINSYIKFIKTQ